MSNALTHLPHFNTSLPCVVTGDFNTSAGKGQPVYDILLRGGRLVDTWEVTEKPCQAYATCNTWQDPEPADERQDWILTTPAVKVTEAPA
ncbi:hypothetical protein [Streptomyces sp. NBRC 110028]|uniref:hypothetical protein n=1 Tax=Streptomyces sp. NBRC 110028 TaxID=1621260 RepID=UPI0006E190E5|nr:hypothetical protein [Streptomyces sp. NBRC 110028]